MDAVVIAGGIPQPQEPLYEYSRGNPKALLDIGGKPMVQWVLDALGEARSIGRIVIIGLTDKSGLTCKKPVVYISNEGRMLANLQAGAAKVRELNPRAEYVLFSTSDIPAVTGPMVDWVVNTSMQTKHDLYYTVIPRQVMEERFPTSRRTYVQLKDLEACGGDLHLARLSIVNRNSEFWEKVIEARKNPAAQASILGFDIIFRFITRQLTADDVIRKVAERLGLKGRALISPFAELGMDVDKPAQLEIMRADVRKRHERKARAGAGRKAPSRNARRRTPARSAKPGAGSAARKGTRTARTGKRRAKSS